MAYFYEDNIYTNYYSNNNYNIINTVPSINNNININYPNTYSTQNYNIPSNNYPTNANTYLTNGNYIYSSKPKILYKNDNNAPIEYRTMTNYVQPKQYQKVYQTSTANNYKQYPTIDTYYSNSTNNQRENTFQAVNPIKRLKTVVQRPRIEPYLTFNGFYKTTEKEKIPNQYTDKNLIKFGNIEYNNNQNINIITKNIVNKESEKVQLQHQKQNNINNPTKVDNQITNLAKVTKLENEYIPNSTNNIAHQNINNDQFYKDIRQYDYKQLDNTPYIKEELLINNNQLNKNNRPFPFQSAHFPNKTFQNNEEFFLGDVAENNNQQLIQNKRNSNIKEPNINKFATNINNENNQYENQIITYIQPLTNETNIINNNKQNNSSFEINKTTTTKNENTQTNLMDNSNQKNIQQSPSPFFVKNGELISNSNSNQYFRKTTTAPVTSYGYCQNQGRRNYMEDKGKVIENLSGDPNKILFCLFDGHGGGQVSTFLQEHFGEYMKKILNCGDYTVGFTELFRAIDGDIRTLNIPSVGSTATIVYIEKQDNKRILYCANIGDSRCVLVNKKNAVRLSYDHRVADHKEKNRILSEGGIIVNGRIYGILMLSRSFGDFMTKDFGVSIIPHVVKYELSEDDLYCVIASDGIWDVIKDKECLLLPNMAKMGMNTGVLARRMINEALKRKSKDNLSCFVIGLN